MPNYDYSDLTTNIESIRALLDTIENNIDEADNRLSEAEQEAEENERMYESIKDGAKSALAEYDLLLSGLDTARSFGWKDRELEVMQEFKAFRKTLKNLSY